MSWLEVKRKSLYTYNVFVCMNINAIKLSLSIRFVNHNAWNK